MQDHWDSCRRQNALEARSNDLVWRQNVALLEGYEYENIFEDLHYHERFSDVFFEQSLKNMRQDVQKWTSQVQAWLLGHRKIISRQVFTFEEDPCTSGTQSGCKS